MKFNTMIKLLTGVFLLTVLLSCGKDPEPPVPEPEPKPADSLSAGWTRISPVSDESFIADVFFYDDAAFFVTQTALYRSTDAGRSWQKAYTLGQDDNFNNIGMGNSKNAIFTTSRDGEILVTNDGGQNLKIVTLENEEYVSDIFFVGPNTVYAIGLYFWKSLDGGNSWTKLSNFNTIASDWYRSLFFLNENLGWLTVHRDGVYKTTDGGMTWNKTSPYDVNISNGYIYGVRFSGNGKGFFSTAYQLWASTDSGDSWNVKREMVSSQFHDIHFVDSATGYYTDGPYLYKTIDGGETWTRDVSIPSSDIVEVHFTDKGHGFACGTNGLLLRYEH